MKKYIWTFMVILVLLPLVACSYSQAKAPEGITIASMTTSLGGEGNNSDKTLLSYTITLQNNEVYDAYIQNITPMLSQSINGKVLSQNTQITVERNLPGHEAMSISGEIWLDTNGLSKEQISALEPFTTGVKITSTMVLDTP